MNQISRVFGGYSRIVIFGLGLLLSQHCLFAAVDVQPLNVTRGSSSVSPGASLSVSWQIRNNGTTAAGTSQSQVRITTSNASNGYGNSGNNVGSAVATGNIAAGATINQNTTVTAPTTPGTYYVWVVADNTSALIQSNTGNDFAVSASFTVVAPTTVDVQPLNVTRSPASIAPGGSLAVSWQIRNNGSGSAATSQSQVRITTSSSSSGNSGNNVGSAVATGTVAAGATINQNTTVTAPSTPGTYYVWVVADNTSVLSQSNTGNDFAVSSSFTVVAPTTVDVQPLNVTRSPSSVAPGASLSVSWQIRNNGTASATTSQSQVRITTSSSSSGNSGNNVGSAVATGTIAAGATINQNTTVTAPTTPGTYYVWVVADNTSVLSQSNTGNDFAVSSSFTVVVPTTVDVEPLNVTRGSSSVAPGGSLSVSWQIRNNGSGSAATSQSQVRITTSNASNGYGSSGNNVGSAVATGTIAAGATINQNTTVTAPSTPGTYYVWVVADNTSVLSQSNTGNDFAVSASFTVVAPTTVDVEPLNVTRSPASVAPGGSLSVSWQIRNNGTASSATSQSQVRITTSNASNGYGNSGNNVGSAVATGTIGASTTINQNTTVTAPTTPGTYYVWVIADNTSVLSQSNTGNDFAVSASFNVVAPTTVDVEPLNVTRSPASVAPGGSLSVSWQIRNNGSASASSSWSQVRITTSNASNGYGNSSHNVGSPVATGTIAAGTTINQNTTVTVPTTPGTYYVWVIADNTSLLAQTTTGNDFAVSASFTVTGNPPITQTLQNGVPVSNLSGAQGNQKIYKITVPSGQAKLDISIAGGTGDCDLYVKFGSAPTTSNYDYRPYLAGNNETVSVNNPAAGDWYVMLNGYASYAGTTLLGSYSAVVSTVATPQISPGSGGYNNSVTVTMNTATAGASVYYTLNGSDPTTSSALYGGAFTLNASATVKARAYKTGMNASAIASQSYTITPSVATLQNNVPIGSLSGAQGNQLLYKIAVPSGQAKLDISISGGTGDCDLYVKFGSAPTTSSYGYRPYLGGNNETVSVSNPASGDWYIMLNGYSTYSAVTLLAGFEAVAVVVAPTFNPPSGSYANFVNVQITTITVGATIRYTTDGTTPTSGSTLYSSPIQIASASTLRAKAFKAGMTDSATASATYTITGTGVVTLQNNTPLGGLSGSQGGLAYYKIAVPTGQAKLTISTSGGTGDCDVYVKRGAPPTISSYDNFPNADGNNEKVSVDDPAAGDWFIMLRGYSAYSGVTLIAKYDSVAPMFVGILGGGPLELGDDPDENPTTWDESQITSGITTLYGSLDSQNINDLRRIATNDLGGLFALAYFFTGKANSHSLISNPGNSDVAKHDIETFFNAHPGAKVFVAGHSVGGGDVQNLLGKLNTLGINVELSGHMDSIEIGDDSTIPSNTKRAMGFYQNDSPIIFVGVPLPFWGQANLSAENASKTTVSNTDIDQAIGPDDPTTDDNAYHRNMDNDERVWGVLLDYIKLRLP